MVLGRYAWAPASFLAALTAGTAPAVLLGPTEVAPLGERTLVTMLTRSWTLFAVDIATSSRL